MTNTAAHAPPPSPIRSSATNVSSAPGGCPATCGGQWCGEWMRMWSVKVRSVAPTSCTSPTDRRYS